MSNLKTKDNKWKNGAIPALLLHCSIGTVYCWSLFSQEISNYIGFSKSATEWAFSFAIFFLGMSAAFLGNIVERDIHKSSLISTICFTIGMLGTGFFIYFGGTPSGNGNIFTLIGIYVFYGLIMGIGLGTGYLSPVKTLMLWFKDKKGLATGLAVAGFGAAKAIASPIMEWMLTKLGDGGIYKMFFILAIVYFIMMFIGHKLLKKPSDWVEPQKTKNNKADIIKAIKTKPIIVYVGIWLMFYLNITAGLAIISQEKMLIYCVGLGSYVGIISTMSAIFNAGGRIVLSGIADKMKDRNTICKIIFAMSILVVLLSIATNGVQGGNGNVMGIIFIILLIMIINAGYGGGFSNVATLLSDYYGVEKISTLHGITLSAWAIAGLTGNQLANWIVTNFGEQIEVNGTMVNPIGYEYVLYVIGALYLIALIISFVFIKKKEN